MCTENLIRMLKLSEMDKSRDVSRGLSRFSPVKRQIKQSGSKLFSGLEDGSNGVLKDKSKKNRNRASKLNVVEKASSSFKDYEMGSFGSDKEHNNPQLNMSSSSKRNKFPKKFFDDCDLIHHTPVPRKLRSAMKKCSRNLLSPDTAKLKRNLTKVECKKKNVNTENSKTDMKNGSLDKSPFTKDEEEVAEILYALAEMFSSFESTNTINVDVEVPGEGFIMSLKAQKNIADIPCPSTVSEATNQSSALQTVNADNLVEREPADKKTWRSFTNIGVAAQQSLESRSKKPTQEEVLPPRKKTDNELNMASHFGMRLMNQDSIEEAKKNGGLSLWPGLSSPYSSEIQYTTPKSFVAKYPAWLNTPPSCTTNPYSTQNNSSSKKVCKDDDVKRKSWKRCAMHVEISHLIVALQTQPNLQRPDEVAKKGVRMTTKIENEARIRAVVQKRPRCDQQQYTPLPFGTQTWKKQSYDFLSLSSGSGGGGGGGGGGMEEGINSNKRDKYWLGLMSQQQHPIPYFHSLPQNQTIYMPPQTRYSSSTYSEQLSASAAPQISIYSGNQFSPNLKCLTKQKQQMWAAAYNNRPEMSQFPNWQDSTTSSSVSQGPKYMMMPRPQQFTATLLHAGVARNHHHQQLPTELLYKDHL